MQEQCSSAQTIACVLKLKAVREEIWGGSLAFVAFVQDDTC
jgi:hypothetical protein